MDCEDAAMKETEKVDMKPADCDKLDDKSVTKDNNMDDGQNTEHSSLNAMSAELEPMECDKTVETAGSSVKTPDELTVMSDSPGSSKDSPEDKIFQLKDEIDESDSVKDVNNSPETNKNESEHLESPEMPNPSDQSNETSPESVEGTQPSCSSTKFHKLKSKVKKRHYRKKSTDTDDAKAKENKKPRDEEEAGSTSTPENSQTKRSDECEHERLSSSSESKSSNSDHEGGDSSEWTTASEDELNGGVPSVLQKEQPKPKMFIVPEVINRQIGNTRQFERRFYGSLHVVQRLELMQKMEEHEGCVNALNFNRQGNLLASASDDLRVVIWDWAIGKKRHAFETGHKSNVFESKWLPLDFENYVVTCARDGQVRLLDICAGVNRKLASHHGPARRLAIHPDDPYTVLSVGDDAKVLSIDIRDPKPKPSKLLTVKEGRSEMYLYSIHINPRNRDEFCVGGRSQAVKIYDRRKLTLPIQTFCPDHLKDKSGAHVTCALFNYNGTEVLASYNDDDIYLFDAMEMHPGDFAHRYEGHRNNATVKSVNFFGPKSEFIVSGSDCGNIFFWDKNTEAIVQWFPGDEQGVVNRLEPHPNVPILATSGLDHDVKIWVPSCEQAPTLNMLQDCVKLNLRNRADDVTREPDGFDGQMLMVFLHHIRQHEGFGGLFSSSAPSRSRLAPRQDDDQSDSSSEQGSVHSDSPSEGANEGPQCATS